MNFRMPDSRIKQHVHTYSNIVAMPMISMAMVNYEQNTTHQPWCVFISIENLL